MNQAFITWTFNPDLISHPITIRWYGIMFVIGFVLGVKVIGRMFRREGTPNSWVDAIFIYTAICTIIGARLGHVFFYAWDYYSQHPEDIIKTWEGGLASHGGAIGILIGLLVYKWCVTKKPYLWALDRLVVPVAMVGGLIRLGNLMNHEIYGHSTDLPWGFRFVENVDAWLKGAEPIFSPPSHPTQIYESLCYFALFGLLMYMYWKRNSGERQGLLTGTFLVGCFASRFLIEFIKNPQEDFEVGMTFDMGQWLSIPFIIVGIFLIIRAFRIEREHINYPDKFAEEPRKK